MAKSAVTGLTEHLESIRREAYTEGYMGLVSCRRVARHRSPPMVRRGATPPRPLKSRRSAQPAEQLVDREPYPDDMPTRSLHRRFASTFIRAVDDPYGPRSHRVPSNPVIRKKPPGIRVRLSATSLAFLRPDRSIERMTNRY
jgi:hypothetical protein